VSPRWDHDDGLFPSVPFRSVHETDHSSIRSSGPENQIDQRSDGHGNSADGKNSSRVLSEPASDPDHHQSTRTRSTPPTPNLLFQQCCSYARFIITATGVYVAIMDGPGAWAKASCVQGTGTITPDVRDHRLEHVWI